MFDSLMNILIFLQLLKMLKSSIIIQLINSPFPVIIIRSSFFALLNWILYLLNICPTLLRLHIIFTHFLNFLLTREICVCSLSFIISDFKWNGALSTFLHHLSIWALGFSLALSRLVSIMASWSLKHITHAKSDQTLRQNDNYQYASKVWLHEISIRWNNEGKFMQIDFH